ncbi:MAG TPA: hypothetical protein VLE27_04110, partial [Thermoanaerobaculia bacterium]|nr:hypothetical protein [Thermoanaerobaculia bacterium]
EDRQLVLFQNGMELPMALLRGGGPIPSGEKDAGAALRFTRLAPGQYSACLARTPVASTGALLDPAALPEDDCGSGQLAAGATLALTLR